MLRGMLIWTGVFCLCAAGVVMGQVRRERPARTAAQAQPPDSPRQAPTTQIAACGFAVSTNLVVTSASAVQGGRDIKVEAVDGIPRKATIVRTDPAAGLALLRTDGEAIGYVGIADSFEGGDIQCVALVRPSIFQPVVETIEGSVARPDEKWLIDLKTAPRLPGAPLVSDNRVVGVTLAADAEQTKRIPTATPRHIAALLADLKLPAARHVFPADAIVRVTCTKPAP